MKAETLKKAIQKATFADGIDEIVIKSDGETGVIPSMGIGKDRLVYVTFPFTLEGEWGITDPEKLIKSLNKIKGDLTIKEEKNKFILSGGGKRYKFPIVDEVCDIKTVLPFTPTRNGSEIIFNGQLAADMQIRFKPDMKEFKAALKDEKVYESRANILFKGDVMDISGKDDSQFEAGDSISGNKQNSTMPEVRTMMTGLHEVAKVAKDLTIFAANGNMLYMEDEDEDVFSIFAIMPHEEERC